MGVIWECRVSASQETKLPLSALPGRVGLEKERFSGRGIVQKGQHSLHWARRVEVHRLQGAGRCPVTE